MATLTDQPTIQLSRAAMPALGLGTWQLSGQECRDAVATALTLGYRHIDTAQMYGNEAEVGAAIEESEVPREDIFVTTKIDNDSHAPTDVRRSLETSLAELRLDTVDLALVHWPVEPERLAATLSELAVVAEGRGLSHHIGVSNFTADQLRIARQFAPVEVLQVECHPYLAQSELRETCEELDVAVTAYSPLARGRVLDDEVVAEVAEGCDASEAQVTLRWLLDLGISAIPKASSDEHMVDNLGALDVELDDEARRRLATLDIGRREVDPDFAPWN